MLRFACCGIFAVVLTVAFSPQAEAQKTKPEPKSKAAKKGTEKSAAKTAAKSKPFTKQEQAAFDRSIAGGIEFLATKGQAADGSYSQGSVAVTALATSALIAHGRSTTDPQVAKGLAYIEKFVREDGGIYSEKSRIPNYETCISIVCLAAANKDGKYDKTIDNAEAYVKHLQIGSQPGQEDKSNPNYGGASYGGEGRADLSNTAMLLDALQAAGNGPEDDAVKMALVFVSRCQNLESEDNTTEFAAKNPDGGFFYTPAAGGASPAGKGDTGGLRSYGSMTYAGLKSMVFSGLQADDPRVKAALTWAAKNYALDQNPGMGQQGLYYYYHLMAKSFHAFGQPTFTDGNNQQHDWRRELAGELIKRQRPDGSWVNDDQKWMEGDPSLVTSFALLTLSYCK